MADTVRPLIAGNWKMNGLKSSLGEFEAMLAGASAVAAKADLLVCPPATLLAAFAPELPAAGGLVSRWVARPPTPRAPARATLCVHAGINPARPQTREDGCR